MYINNVATNEVAKGIIYLKFDEENAGNSYKDNCLPDIFTLCVPISVRTDRFSFKR